MYQQAYFPLFPLIIHILASLFGYGYFITGIFITNCSFLFGLYFFKKYLESIHKSQKTIRWVFLMFLLFPMSFFFESVYTESLFFLLISAVLYYSQKRKYWLIILLSMCAALTRLMGIFLILPLFMTILVEQHNFHIPRQSFKIEAHMSCVLWWIIVIYFLLCSHLYLVYASICSTYGEQFMTPFIFIMLFLAFIRGEQRVI